MAINELTRFIADSPDAFSTAGTSIDGMLPLLESLAGTNAGEIAALVPHVIGDLPSPRSSNRFRHSSPPSAPQDFISAGSHEK
jgi:hypothetical protein